MLHLWGPQLGRDNRWACPLSGVTSDPCQVPWLAWQEVKGEVNEVVLANSHDGCVLCESCVVFVGLLVGFRWTSGGLLVASKHLIENRGPSGTGWCCYGCGLAPPFWCIK